MSIDIGDAISRGFDDLTSARGAAVLGMFVALGIAMGYVFLMFFESLINWVIANTEVTREEVFVEAGDFEAIFAFTPDVPLAVSVLLILVLMLLSVLINIVSIRAFASDSSEPIPVDEVTRNLGRTFVFYILAGILAIILIGIGTLLIVLPGLVAAFLLYFTQFAVVIDDAGPVEALKKSYGVVTDNPIEALVLILAFMALGVVISLPFAFLPIPEPINSIVSNLISLAVSVFSIATFTDAYLQATGQRGTSPDTGF